MAYVNIMCKCDWSLKSNTWKFIMENPKWSEYDIDMVDCQLNWSAILDSTLLLLLLLSFFYSSCACLAYKTTSENFYDGYSLYN